MRFLLLTVVIYLFSALAASRNVPQFLHQLQFEPAGVPCQVEATVEG